jgi:hypothetical protein
LPKLARAGIVGRSGNNNCPLHQEPKRACKFTDQVSPILQTSEGTAMKLTVHAAAIALCLASPFVAAAPAPAQDQAPAGKITIEYGASKFADTAGRMKKLLVLEELQQFLAALRLPKNMMITAKDCGAQTLAYQAGGPVTICYDLIYLIEEQAKKIYPQDTGSQALVVVGATIQALLHETAHGLFDVLQVPIWGREDDAADRLAALMMMQFGEDLEKVTIYGTTALFKSMANAEKTWTGSDFADTASPEAQRYYNYLCIAAGADLALFGGALVDGTIPTFRAGDCGYEYDQIKKAFDLRIMPFIDADALVKVRATQWLNWSPGK